MRKIALFDMDGTLIDSGHDITISINYVRSFRYSLPPLEVQHVIDAINAHQRNLADIFYSTPVYESDAKALFEEHYHEQCVQNVRSYEGIAELLQALEAKEFAMGVATNAPSLFARRMLTHLGLEHYFSDIIGADRVETPKPHPQMLQTHLSYHGFDSALDQAWMIGDNSKDMEAAKNAGIRSIFAAWGFSREGKGDFIAHHPLKVLEIIDSHANLG